MAEVALKLQASADGGASVSTIDGKGDPAPFVVEEGTRVTLTLTAPNDAAITDIEWQRLGDPLPMDEVTVGEGLHEISFKATGAFFAAYQATGTVGDTSLTSQTLILKKKPAAGSGDPAGEKTPPVAEVEIGEYDAAFAKAGFITLALAVALLFVLGLLWVSDVPLPGLTQPVVEDQQVMGTFAERLVGRAVLIGAIAGLALLLVGSYLAALETRGRLRAKVTLSGEQLESDSRGPIADLAKEVLEPAMKAMQSMRGTVAVLVVGALLLGGSLLLASSLLGGTSGSGSGPGTSDTDGVTQSPDTVTSTSSGP